MSHLFQRQRQNMKGLRVGGICLGGFERELASTGNFATAPSFDRAAQKAIGLAPSKRGIHLLFEGLEFCECRLMGADAREHVQTLCDGSLRHEKILRSEEAIKQPVCLK
jgi:hypothetical protein